jgi:ElaB/YqjD/DUF883 family membrane-anchored ribosome-binding protein
MSQSKFQSASVMEDRAAQTISNAANAAGAAVRDATSQFADTASELGRNARSRADDAIDDIAERVVNQPISAVLIAAGVGFVAGLILSRR